MSSTEVAQTGLDRGLAELERLGLARPSNVLFAEYLSALTAEEVLDAAVAQQIAAAFNRARYSAVSDDDPETNEATTALELAIARLGAMSAEERNEISQRVRDRISAVPAAPIPQRESEWSLEASPALTPDHLQDEIPIGDYVEASRGLADPRKLILASPRQEGRRRGRLPRISLEMCALVALATFFGGYFLREAANKVAGEKLDRREPQSISHGWAGEVRQLGTNETTAQHFGRARRVFEFASAFSGEKEHPLSHDELRDLNNFAWAYVNPDEHGTTNPKRAAELIEKVIKVDRNPIYLDTAAETQFQLGNFAEAIRLEREAIARGESLGLDQYMPLFERELLKFREAERHAVARSADGKK
jgi:tetratricopeptide (TPR) repeat protein